MFSESKGMELFENVFEPPANVEPLIVRLNDENGLNTPFGSFVEVRDAQTDEFIATQHLSPMLGMIKPSAVKTFWIDRKQHPLVDLTVHFASKPDAEGSRVLGVPVDRSTGAGAGGGGGGVLLDKQDIDKGEPVSFLPPPPALSGDNIKFSATRSAAGGSFMLSCSVSGVGAEEMQVLFRIVLEANGAAVNQLSVADRKRAATEQMMSLQDLSLSTFELRMTSGASASQVDLTLRVAPSDTRQTGQEQVVSQTVALPAASTGQNNGNQQTSGNNPQTNGNNQQTNGNNQQTNGNNQQTNQATSPGGGLGTQVGGSSNAGEQGQQTNNSFVNPSSTSADADDADSNLSSSQSSRPASDNSNLILIIAIAAASCCAIVLVILIVLVVRKKKSKSSASSSEAVSLGEVQTAPPAIDAYDQVPQAPTPQYQEDKFPVVRTSEYGNATQMLQQTMGTDAGSQRTHNYGGVDTLLQANYAQSNYATQPGFDINYSTVSSTELQRGNTPPQNYDNTAAALQSQQNYNGGEFVGGNNNAIKYSGLPPAPNVQYATAPWDASTENNMSNQQIHPDWLLLWALKLYKQL